MRSGMALAAAAAMAALAVGQAVAYTTTNGTDRGGADAVIVTGKILPIRDSEGTVTGVSLLGTDGNLYRIEKDEQGRRLAALPALQSVRVTGTTNTANDRLIFRVREFTAVPSSDVR